MSTSEKTSPSISSPAHPAIPPEPGGPGGGGCTPGTDLFVTASATPTGEMPLGTRIELSAQAEAVRWSADCHRTTFVPDAAFSWSLTRHSYYGTDVVDVTGLLTATDGPVTSFVTRDTGFYQATVTAGWGLDQATDQVHVYGFAYGRVYSPFAPAVTSAGGDIVLVGVSDGLCFATLWFPEDANVIWTELSAGGHSDAKPAAALMSRSDLVHDFIFAIVKGLDGYLYLNQGYVGYSFVGWERVDFQSNLAPAMASAGDIAVSAAVAPDGRIFYSWWRLGGVGQWIEVPGGGRTDAAPALALVGDDHDYLFVAMKGLDGNLYLNQGHLGRSFTGWERMEFRSNLAPAAAGAGNNAALVAVAPDGQIFANSWQLGGAGLWYELPGEGRTKTAPSAALSGDNHDVLIAFIRGIDGNSYFNQGQFGGPFTGWRGI